MTDVNYFIYYGKELENKSEGSDAQRQRNEFYRTVNSSTVWGPKQFRSSKSQKAVCLNQNPSDFMDDEDVGIFGIAPQNIQIKGSFGDVLGFTRSKTDHTEQTDNYVRLKWNKNWNLIVKNLLEQAGWINNAEFVAPFHFVEEVGGIIFSSDAPIKQNRDVGRCTVLNKISVRNRFYGLGYVGLQRGNCVTEKCTINSHFAATISHTKVENITPGQAFVMRIFEQDDEDIYEVEEANKFDFYPDSPIEKSYFEKNTNITKCVSGFSSHKKSRLPNKGYTVLVPPHFKPRKIRFELVIEKSNQLCQQLVQRTFSACTKANASNCQENAKHLKDTLVPPVTPVTSNTTAFEKDNSFSLKKDFTNVKNSEPKKRTKMAEIAQPYYLNKTLKLMDDRFISEFDLTIDGSKKQYQPVEKTTASRLIELWSPHNGLCKRFKISQGSLKRSNEARGTTDNSSLETSALGKQALVQHEARNKNLYGCNIQSPFSPQGKTEAARSKRDGCIKNQSQERSMIFQEEIKRKNLIFEENDLFGLVFGK